MHWPRLNTSFVRVRRSHRTEMWSAAGFDLEHEVIAIAVEKEDEDVPKGVRFSPDGLMLATADGRRLYTYDLPADSFMDAADAPPGGGARVPGTLAAAGRRAAIPHAGLVYDYAWWPQMNALADASTAAIATTAKDCPIVLHDAVSGSALASYVGYSHLDAPMSALSVALHPACTTIYGGYDGQLQLFDASRPGRPKAVARTTPTRKAPHGQKGLLGALAVCGPALPPPSSSSSLASSSAAAGSAAAPSSAFTGGGLLAAGSYRGGVWCYDAVDGSQLFAFQARNRDVRQCLAAAEAAVATRGPLGTLLPTDAAAGAALVPAAVEGAGRDGDGVEAALLPPPTTAAMATLTASVAAAVTASVSGVKRKRRELTAAAATAVATATAAPAASNGEGGGSYSRGVTQLQWSRDGRLLFAGYRNSSCILCWDVRDHTRPLAAFPRDAAGSQRLVFDVDATGTLLATGSRDGSVRFYDVQTGAPAGVVAGFPAAVNGVALHPYGRVFACAVGEREAPGAVVGDSSEGDDDSGVSRSAAGSGGAALAPSASGGTGSGDGRAARMVGPYRHSVEKLPGCESRCSVSVWRAGGGAGGGSAVAVEGVDEAAVEAEAARVDV